MLLLAQARRHAARKRRPLQLAREGAVLSDAARDGGGAIVVGPAHHDARFVIAENDAANEWSPGLWSRFDWAWDGDGALWFCQTAYAAATEAEARATPAADPTSPSTGGCGGFSWTRLDPALLGLRGAWVDNWGGGHQVDSATWLSGSSTFAVTRYDNLRRFAIAQNSAFNEYNPGLWSRFDWTVDGAGVPHFCQTAYAAATEAEAVAAAPADAADLAGGCGGFSWSSLAPVGPDLAGDWVDNWGGTHLIGLDTWVSGDATFHFATVDNVRGSIIAQNDAANPWSPGLWSRFDWTTDGEGQRWFCQTAYDAPSERAAWLTAAADATSPSTGGCGGFSWSALDPAVR